MTAPFKGYRRLVMLGSSGFIGSRVCEVLRDRLPALPIEGLSLPEIDLTRRDDVASLAQLFDSDTLVIMTAAVKKQFGDSLDAMDQNLQMVSNVCRMLEQHPVARFVYFSSAAVYGEDVHNLAITEDTPVCPRTYYGIAKYASERMLAKVAESKDVSLLLLRPPTVYGPGDTTNTYGPAGFVRAALKGETITLWGDGGELREFVHVDDLAAAVVELTFSSAQGPVNVATGESHTFHDVLDLIESALGLGLDVVSRPRSMEKVDNAYLTDGLRGAVPDLRFRSLADGIDALIAEERVSLLRSRQ